MYNSSVQQSTQPIDQADKPVVVSEIVHASSVAFTSIDHSQLSAKDLKAKKKNWKDS